MILYYVEHEVLVRRTYAVIAADDEDLKKELAAREVILRAAPFTPKFQRDKAGAISGFEMNKDWTRAPLGPAWSPTTKG